MTWSPASGRKELELQLRRVGGMPDEEIDTAEAALALAALDRPRVPLARYSRHLSSLAEETGALAAERRAERSLHGRTDALRTVLVERYGYQGDGLTYDDLQNANLMRVIDRRKGLPVALGLLYIAAARPHGWSIQGLNFPGHFLLRLELGSEGVILDPFNNASVLDTGELRGLLKSFVGEDAELAPEHYRPMGNREILLRLQNNIKLRRLQAGQAAEALDVLETMLMFAPSEGALWHEAGVLHAHLGNLRAATMALEHVLELSRDSQARHEAAALLQRIKGRMN